MRPSTFARQSGALLLVILGVLAVVLLARDQTPPEAAVELPAGTYQLFLWMPDPASAVRDRPEYAIRLANEGTWDAETGYNDLGHTVVVGASASNGVAGTRTYTADEDDFLNPERGLYLQHQGPDTGYNALQLDNLKWHQQNNKVNLVRLVFNLRAFRDTDTIDAGYLVNMQRDFDTIRNANMKVIVRFAYDYSGNATNDVPFHRMEQHIEQLARVVNANSDVIALYEAGFIGKWGEWHGSTHYGDEGRPETNWASRPQVLQKILDEFEDRPVSLRYPRHLRYMLNPSGSPRVKPVERLGALNDAFLADRHDGGTYEPGDPAGDAGFLASFMAEGPGKAMGGEHESFGATAAERQARFAEFDLYDWSYLSYNAYTDNWRTATYPGSEMTYWDYILRHLGYRIVLDSADLPTSVAPGDGIPVSIRLRNVGWAAPFNERDVVIVLRDTATGAEFHFPLPADPREWKAGEVTLTHVLRASDAIRP
jgi:hypothetical protein